MATDSMTLLQKTQALIEVERSLTATLEKVEPWLTQSNNNNSNNFSTSMGKRVRPIPTTMYEVKQILAVSRNFASRTSAPAGWNPMAPVVGFSTPNPLPHQLRGGALATLQLERARQDERKTKRKRQEEEQEAAKAKKRMEAETQQTSNTTQEQPNQSQQQSATNPKAAATTSQPMRRAARPQPQVLATTMNLSDSSSSEDESEDED
jgi:hypothetical protein